MYGLSSAEAIIPALKPTVFTLSARPATPALSMTITIKEKTWILFFNLILLKQPGNNY